MNEVDVDTFWTVIAFTWAGMIMLWVDQSVTTYRTRAIMYHLNNGLAIIMKEMLSHYSQDTDETDKDEV